MSDLQRHLPQLDSDNYQVTSVRTTSYNCIAWAAGDSERWWWPDTFSWYYWPPEVPRRESIEAFIQAFTVLGYEVCVDGAQEVNLEKVAIFADPLGTPTHAARQLPSGRWTSKCGKLEDIEHDLPVLAGDIYGRVVCYMKRSLGEKA